MSLMKMLTKVAVGFAVAKGMKAVTSGGGLGKMLGGGAGGAQQAGTGAPYDGGQTAGGQAAGGQTTGAGGQGGGLGSILGGLAGGAGGGSGGGLGDIMGQLTGRGGASGQGGGIGDMLGQLTGGKMNSAPGGLGGIDTLLGGLAGARGGNAGNMEGLLHKEAPASEPEPESTAGLMIRAMLMAARSDGQVDDDEKKILMDTIGEDATAEDMDFVKGAMAEPVDAAKLAADTPKGMETQVYSMSVMSITPDNQAEAQYLHSLVSALGLEQSTANEIHDNFGVPKLYS